MKTTEKRRQSDYILLHTLLGKYLDTCTDNGSLAPRYSGLDKVNDFVDPFYQMKVLVQRIEWLDNAEDVMLLIENMICNGLSMEELKWAIDMFAIQKQLVFNKIEKSINNNG